MIWSGQAVEFGGERGAQGVVLWAELVLRGGAVLAGVVPDGSDDLVGGFPGVPGVDVGVQVGVVVAEDLVVDAPERGVEAGAGGGDGLAEQVHVGEEGEPAGAGQVGEAADCRVVGEQDAVSGEELAVADGHESGGEAGEDGRVLAAQG